MFSVEDLGDAVHGDSVGEGVDVDFFGEVADFFGVSVGCGHFAGGLDDAGVVGHLVYYMFVSQPFCFSYYFHFRFLKL